MTVVQRKVPELFERIGYSGTVIAIILGTACGREGHSEPSSCDTATLTVTPGAALAFSWEPSRCGVYLLTVTHDSAGSRVVDWLVEGQGKLDPSTR